jgi:altronate dehydratase small subunit
MELKLALKVSDQDNVATIFASGVSAGSEVEMRDKQGRSECITVLNDIPYGHKIAVTAIRSGESVYKYGEEIGVAGRDVRTGEHVHVHNLDSRRGRGDLQDQPR